MGTASTAGMFIASSLLSAQSTLSAGKIAAKEGKLQARQTELGAISREADRKSALADMLASQNASAGARGIAAFEGSPLTILQADIEREEQATQRDKFSTELEAFTQRSRGKQAKSASKSQMAIGLLQAGTSFASIVKTPTVPKTTKTIPRPIK